MEITNEIKLKVFAQYLGQKALTNKQSYKDPSAGKLSQVDISTNELVTDGEGGYYLSDTSNTKLILKQLSAISDGDAIEVAKIISYRKTNLEHLKEDIFDFFVDDNLIIKSTVISINSSFQYLQSKGYDLPQYLLGGKTLKEVGMAIYENEI